MKTERSHIRACASGGEMVLHCNMKPILLAVAVVAGSCFGATAQHSPVAAAHALKLGAKAPDFSLNDQSGAKRSLGEFTAKGPVALIFFRSAEW